MSPHTPNNLLLQNKVVNLLVVDDDEDDFFIIGDYIKSINAMPVSVTWCDNYNAALQHMINKDFHVYMVDYRLGMKSGVDLLKDAIENKCEDPIILLTGFGNYNIDMQAMKLGAVDYLVKSELTPEKIERTIRYALERSSTLKAINASERKYRAIFEKSKDVIFTADENMVFNNINDIVTSLLGYSVEECIGNMSLYDLVAQDEQKEYLKNVLSLQEEINDWEVVLNTKNEKEVICYLTVTKELAAEDEEYIQGIIHDITAHRKNEKAHLQNEKQALARRMVQTMAHEIRNPLNNISLSIEQLQHELKDDNAFPFINIIGRNINRINDLITELMAISHPAELELTPTPLQTILDNTINAALDRMTLKKIKLSVNYPEQPIYIQSHPQTLSIALLNIVINAIEAVKEETGKLTIKLVQEDGTAVLTIEDNGCGISKEDISHLFEPYFTKKRNGVGMGLAATLNILQGHNAGIEVISTVGECTEFKISFPVSVIQG